MKDDLDYVKNSQYRIRVLKSLEGGEVKIPSQIAKDSDIYVNHISNTLAQLRKRDIIECVNPEVRKGRLYRLTDKGNDIASKVEPRDEKDQKKRDLFQKNKISGS